MKPHDYMEATYEALQVGVDVSVVCERLKFLLKKRGHDAFYKKILRTLAQKLERDQKRHTTRILVARESDIQKIKNDIVAVQKRCHLTDEYSVDINSNIIGGFIFENDSLRVDHSHRRRLMHLYQKVTS